ncbi:MAG: amino acid ABC transporter permease [Clostridia bacterium]|nr:amino acid ABC transporter permease [Clostridia bacterium]
MGTYLEGILVALKGVPMTLAVAIIAVAIGFCVGLLLALMKLSKKKILRAISNVYVEIIRGTPLLVQALIFAYGLPQVFGFHYPRYVFGISGLIIPAIIVCGFNSAAYMAEVIRGGIQAVPKGQREAALALGMSRIQVMKLVVIPQAFKIVVPSLGNEVITMIKETSVLSYVGVVEILRQAALWNASTFETFPAYVGAAIVYLCLTIPLSRLVKLIEVKLAGGVK